MPQVFDDPTDPVPEARPGTFYDEVGGWATFVAIVDRFYAIAAGDPVLGPLFATARAAEVRGRLVAFFAQYWGGPRTYARDRGDPRLSVRHSSFRIGRAEHDAYLAAMREAIAIPALTARHRQLFLDHLEAVAARLVNVGP